MGSIVLSDTRPVFSYYTLPKFANVSTNWMRIYAPKQYLIIAHRPYFVNLLDSLFGSIVQVEVKGFLGIETRCVSIFCHVSCSHKTNKLQIPVQLTNHFWTVTGVGKGTVKRLTKTCNLFCNIAAIWVESRFFAFYLPRIKPVLQQIRLLQIVKPFCKEKIRKEKRSPIFSSKICTCWAFYRPKANYSFAASDENVVYGMTPE